MKLKILLFISLIYSFILYSCSTSIENKTISVDQELENSTESQTEIHEKSENDSCTENITYFENESKISSQSIQDFLKYFQTLSLPLTLSKWEIVKICDDFPKYNIESIDTLFVTDNTYPFYYGMLPDTSKYYGLIYFLGGVQEIPPRLVTMDKSGKIISEEILFCKCGCQSSLLIKTCNSYFTIEENLEIHSLDSIEEGDFDENFQLNDSTVSLVIQKKNGKIDESGRISFSEQIRIE